MVYNSIVLITVERDCHGFPKGSLAMAEKIS
jgi:hypothetical protein